jgi:hypothetical protein
MSGAGDGDEVRLLATRSEHGYTDDPTKALSNEPEAVPADEQARQTAAAHRRDRQRRVDAYESMRAVVLPALDEFVGVVRDPPAERAVRAVRRTLDAVERRL